MRDALVAAVNLNIFNKHCDRVKMANIAQLVNVLQSVILTEGKKMILTPTYHAFDMYRCHQGNELLDSFLETETIGMEEAYRVPNLHESVSVDKEGVIHIPVANLSYDVDSTMMHDWARIMGIEHVHIGEDTTFEAFEKELIVNDIIWKFK